MKFTKFVFNTTVVECGDPPEIENGQVVNNITTCSGVVMYGCDPGYLFVGDLSSTCERTDLFNVTGHWSGTRSCEGYCF